MQPRRIARELALLSIGQLSTSAQLTESQEIEAAMTAAIRALSEEVRETLESASEDLNRSSDRILTSEIQASDIASARKMLNAAIEMTQAAINRLGTTLDLPEFIQVAQTPEVREFAYALIRACRTRRDELDAMLSQALVDWQLTRLAKIDQNILRLAVAEIAILGIPDRVAINESVELAKRYSAEDGHRFINGVLRRVTQNLKNPDTASPADLSATEESVSPFAVDSPENRKVISNPGAQDTDTTVNPGSKIQKEKRRVIPSPAERKAQKWAQNKPKLVPKTKKRVFDLSGYQIEQKQGVNLPETQENDENENPSQNHDTGVLDSNPSDGSMPEVASSTLPDTSNPTTSDAEDTAVPSISPARTSSPEDSFAKSTLSSNPTDLTSESFSSTTSDEDLSTEPSDRTSPEATSVGSKISSNREEA